MMIIFVSMNTVTANKGNYYYGARSRRDWVQASRRRRGAIARPSPARRRGYYDPKISVWLSVDPMASSYPHLTPYNFLENNPVMFVDPTGMNSSPIYDENGQRLGIDSEGFKGDIITMNRDEYNKRTENNTKTLDHSEAMANGKVMDKSNVSPEVMENIIADVMCGYKLPNGITLDYNNFEISSVPSDEGSNARYDGLKDGKHQVSERGFYYEYTVENIRATIGNHEVYGHGILKHNKRSSHYFIYEMQLKHDPQGTTNLYKQNQYYNLWRFYPPAQGGQRAPQKYWEAYIKYGGE